MKIAIAGYGLEGQENYRYWAENPENELTIADQRELVDVPEGASVISGPDAFEQLDGFDLVVRTPSLSPYKIKTDGKLWSATDEFFEKSPAPIIGVTGTKGKGTTSSMIASIFEAAGRKVWLVGNIGTPALGILSKINKNDIIVYELSSFQLWKVERSPQTAVVLGIEPEHLDVHRDMNDYVNAKGNIRRYQQDGDICVYNAGNDYSVSIAESTEKGEKLPYGLNVEAGGHVKDNLFYVGEHIICSVDELQLKGEHNIENACAAISVAHRLGVSNDDIAAGIRNFKGLPHRLEFVRTFNGVDYYNDSFSSSTPATVAAARAFSQPEILIVGGIDRGGDFDHLFEELNKQQNIKKLIVIGDIRHKLGELLSKTTIPYVVSDAQTMGEIVHQATDMAREGDVIILSPGCASFDMFKDFSDRGDQFKRNVMSLGSVGKGTFIFKKYEFDPYTYEVRFTYQFEDGPEFHETVTFARGEQYDAVVLEKALQLSLLLTGTSYFKTYPTTDVRIDAFMIDQWQAEFLNKVYQEGLSQFAFENELGREDLAHFKETGEAAKPVVFNGNGTLLLQSGGKDSLLVAAVLREKQVEFSPWYLANSDHHPAVLDELGYPLTTARRQIDREGLKQAAENGAKNGHVPVTYILQSFAVIQAVLAGKNQILASIGHEGEEPHAMIGDLAVTHQWSKTWGAEQLFAEYVRRYISPDIKIGSPLRRYSELRVAELFSDKAWDTFGHRFSSCNLANYKQGDDNSELTWCGECPKCANSYLLFAPFVEAEELKSLFGGQDLFTKPMLQETFKGLLGVGGVMKPFECVGEIDELRYAYHRAQEKGGFGTVSFDVPRADFDYLVEYPVQDWTPSLT